MKIACLWEHRWIDVSSDSESPKLVCSRCGKEASRFREVILPPTRPITVLVRRRND